MSVPHVLIVDDADDNREMYSTFLAQAGGYRVSQARSGRDALEAMLCVRPDVLVLDLLLPDVDGASRSSR